MIESSFFTLAIFLMAGITFTVRYAFFTTSFEIKLSDNLKSLLMFTAPCILTAMFIPIMFQEAITTENPISALYSPYFLAGVGAIMFSLFIKNTLIVIVLSMVVFYSLRLLI